MQFGFLVFQLVNAATQRTNSPTWPFLAYQEKETSPYSIWIPRSSTDETNFITWLSTWKFVFVRSERFLFNSTIAWNLLGFTIILFILNHSIAILLFTTNLFIRYEIVFAHAESALSSEKLWIEEDSLKKKRSLIEKSNRSGWTIEPCCTPEMIFSKLLYTLFIRTHCFRFFKSEKIKQIA